MFSTIRPIASASNLFIKRASSVRYSSTTASLQPLFHPTHRTSAHTKVPYGTPSLASSAYLPSSDPTITNSRAVADPATTETPMNLTPKQRQHLERIIRVDQAGELGANYIYMGQVAVLGRGKDKNVAELIQVSTSIHLFAIKKTL